MLDSENPLLNVLRTNELFIPANILKQFELQFPDAQFIEWEKQDIDYEVSFYLESTENIALFSESGILIWHKIYLSEDSLPTSILEKVKANGEIMNVVEINQGNESKFELICRDQHLIRKMFVYNQKGELIETTLL